MQCNRKPLYRPQPGTTAPFSEKTKTQPPPSHRQGPIFLNVLRVLDMPQAVALASPRKVRLYVKDDAEAKAWEWPLRLQKALAQENLQIRKVGK